MSTAPHQPAEPPQPAQQPTEPHVDRGVGQAYRLFAICVCLLVSVGAAAQTWSLYFGLAVTEAMIFLLAVLYVRRKRLPIAAALGWRPISPATAFVSLLLGVSGWGIASEIQSLATPFIGQGPDVLMKITTLGELAIALWCAAILPGICEETLFRGAIQGTLNRRGPVTSVLITSLLFALFHLNPWNFLPPLFWGVALGILTLRTGSTIPAMIAHASSNATACTLEYLLGGELDPHGFLALAALSPAFVLVFSIFLVKTRHHPFEPGLLARVPASLSRRALAAIAVGTVVFVWLAFFVFSNWVGIQIVNRPPE